MADLHRCVRRIERLGPTAESPPDAIGDYVQDVELLVAHMWRVDAELIRQSPKLSMIGVCRAGTENADRHESEARGIRLVNMPVRNAVVKETTNLGAAMCALVGIGQYSSLGEASAALVRWDRTVDPDADSAAVYKGVAERALDLQRGLIDWVEAGRLQEMWRAVGVAAIDGNHQR